jgi:hypothetical protein
VSNALVDARKEGSIPREWIEDRLRRSREVSMWDNLGDLINAAVNGHRRDVWPTQPAYVEVWLEGAPRLFDLPDELIPTTVLYFGDFDLSGEVMVRSLGERLEFFGIHPTIKKCALTADDVTRYQLPPDFTKTADIRRAAFVAKYGDMAVELDALPVDVLRARVVEEVEALMDLDALAEVRRIEEDERRRLAEAVCDLS